MGDGQVIIPIEEEIKAHKRRTARLALPAVALSEWAELHSVNPNTAKGWAQRHLFPPGAVWQSGRDYLIRPTEPVPDVKPGPKPK